MKQTDKEKSGNISGDKRTSGMPEGYDIDTIMIMPVNVDTSFIYWEITDRLLEGKLLELNPGPVDLMIKVFESGHGKEVCSFKIKDRIGKRYINCHTSLKPLTAEAGILKDGEFTGFLKSKNFAAPFFETPGTGDETWMKKTEYVCEIINAGRNEIPVAEEPALLKYYEDAVSSHENPLSGRALFTLPSSWA
ncbi:MAG TPA: DUF4912 domain-containing protein [Nitrospirae bacterium]|nr:hypothetical protein BMS3Abin06_02780 [bacterium BMS3Abin06]HDH10591.1 DUF4912 domain-containing protein [Nitrospirota bacterium]HDZ00286.1 DUF4912 domain-containing protein [Nitrospirota bacterium]